MRKPHEKKDSEKCYPRYDDHAHIDSAAIDPPPPRPKEDYTAQYLAPLQASAAVPPEA